jgi:type I restriction enzyme S subunit
MKADCYAAHGVPVIRGNNISDTKALVGEFVFISEEKADELASCTVYDGDLVFPHRGLIGEVGLLAGTNGRYMLSTSLMKLTPNRRVAAPAFLFYYFRSPSGRHELLKNASQVGTPGIATPLTSLRSIRVPVPPMAEQESIAHLLGALDDKIDLNRRTNETLESIARAIFKSWFVDFDPVRAKAEGRQPAGMGAETAALFPASWEDTPLGPVPAGWGVSPLGDVCEFAYGRALREDDRRPGAVPVFGSNGQVGWHDTSLVRGPGVVVGRKGNPGVVTWADADFFPIDTTFYLLPRNHASLFWLFHLLESLGLQLLGSDSAVPGLNRGMAYMSEVIAPSVAAQRAFDRLAAPPRFTVSQKEREIRTLAEIRDALLPKLLSGEIRIRDAEKLVGTHL